MACAVSGLCYGGDMIWILLFAILCPAGFVAVCWSLTLFAIFWMALITVVSVIGNLIGMTIDGVRKLLPLYNPANGKWIVVGAGVLFVLAHIFCRV